MRREELYVTRRGYSSEYAVILLQLRNHAARRRSTVLFVCLKVDPRYLNQRTEC